MQTNVPEIIREAGPKVGALHGRRTTSLMSEQGDHCERHQLPGKHQLYENGYVACWSSYSKSDVE
jgi:hypothetical protein